jgi:hypothetical protein
VNNTGGVIIKNIINGKIGFEIRETRKIYESMKNKPMIIAGVLY